ncbi:MAG: rhomboid family intramembrane serine protease [Bacteroidia bacterium]|jgi:membrane associated rhomboid family serine protease|nr:rhomboid family intramembrane serine protease [Bacteroidia bacterium]
MNLYNELRYQLNKTNSAIHKIIAVNVVVFVCVALVNVVFFLGGFQSDVVDSALRYVYLPAQLGALLTQPWSIVTYMFLHDGFLHLLFNMLWLYWLGKLLQEYIGHNKVYQAYFGGGLAGAVLFLLCMNLFPVFAPMVASTYALGASAGVLGVVVAAATLLPNYPIQLLFFGTVRLKYIAIITVLLDVIGIPQGNAGGHIAHLGGALFGLVYIKYLYQSNYIFPAFIRKWFTPKSKLRIYSRNTNIQNDKPSEEEIDLILDKIAKSGYDSLSKRDKERLFKASNEQS